MNPLKSLSLFFIRTFFWSLFLLAGFQIAPVLAFTANVTTTAGDNSAGSIGDAINQINTNGGGNIDLSAIAGGTINQTSAFPLLTQSATILGNNVTLTGGAGEVFNLQNAVTMNQLTLGGSLSVSISGSGSNVYLTGANSFSGGTTVSTQGLVGVGADNNLGATTSSLTLNNGTLQTTTGTTFNVNRALNITANGGTFDTNGQNSTWNGSINWLSSTAALTVTGGGAVTFSPADSGGTGAVYYQNNMTINGGATFSTTTDSGGTEYTSNSLTLNNGTFQVYGTGVTNTFTDYQGIITLGPGGGIFDTAANTNTILSSSITGTGSLTASGPGTLILANATSGALTMSYSGGTLITGGAVVQVDQSGSGVDYLGPGAVTINDGTLRNNSSVLNVSQNIVLAGIGGTLDVEQYQMNVNGLVSGSAPLTITANNPSVDPNCYDCNGNVFLNNTGNNFTGGLYLTGKTILNVTDDHELGALGAPMTMDNGNIQDLLGDFSTARDIYIVSEGGFEPEGHNDTVSGLISGPGFLLLKDGGTVALTNAGNTYSGGTSIIELTTAIVGADSDLGAPTGGVTLNQGAIQVTSDINFNASRTMDLQTDGGFFDTNGHNSSWNGLITGPGEFDTLSTNGDGSITLTQQETYTGATNIADYVISGLGGPAPGTAGHTQLVLAVPGTLPSSTAVSIGFEGILNLDNLPQTIGSLDGQSTALVSIGSGYLNVGNNNNGSLYAGTISGTGNMAKVGTGTLTLDGVNTYTGGTDIQNGALQVGSSVTFGAVVAGPVTVENGATLEGFGTLSGSVTNNGMVQVTAPSGALSITQLNDSLASQMGLQVLPGNFNSSRFNIGNASLNGALTVTADPGIYAVRYKYIVLSASSPLAGTFSGGVTDNLSYMTPSLLYGTNAVTLILMRNNTDFTANAITSNQLVAGTALNQSLGVATDAFFDNLNALYLLSPADQRTALTQMGGSSYASLVQVMLNQNEFAMQDLSGQFGLSAPPSGVSGMGMSGSPSNGTAAADVNTKPGTNGWWAEGTGDLGRWNGNSNVAGYNIQDYGAISGFRADIEEGLEAGLALDYNQSNLTSTDFGNIQTGVASLMVAGYEKQSLGPLDLSLMAGYGFDQYTTTRTVVMGSTTAQPQSSFTGSRFAAAMEFSTNLMGKSKFALTPKAGVQYAHLAMNGFTETNAGSLDLTVAPQNYDSIRPYLGMTAAQNFPLGKGMQLIPNIDVTASREMIKIDPQVQGSFDGASSVTFTTDGSTAADPLMLGFNIGSQLAFADHWNIYLDYNAHFGWGESLSALRTGLNLAF